MKKLIALLLALMLALALAVPASAAGEDIGIIGGADGPTYILVSADPKAAATVSKEQREQNIKALGGVAGQVNVLLGDRCIAFTLYDTCMVFSHLQQLLIPFKHLFILVFFIPVHPTSAIRIICSGHRKFISVINHRHSR